MSLLQREAYPAGTIPSEILGYEILDVLGQGAGATLYVACEPATGQLYALKHAIRRTDKDVRFIEQMRVEHEVGSSIRHKSLRRSVEFKVAKNLLGKPTEAILLLEIVDGKPLDCTCETPLHAMVSYFAQTAGALTALHERGFLHCDLKPANILVGPEGEVKVIDLGQACRVGSVKERIQGTPDFIAPEQVRCEQLTERTDVFNFGATFYWALTARKLPTMLNIGNRSRSFIVDETIPTPQQLNPTIPEHISKLVMECVNPKPERRPASMEAIATKLDTAAYALKRKARFVDPDLEPAVA